MVAVRPKVDGLLLEFIQRHEFTKKDFYEKRDDGLRLTLKITCILAETTSSWSEYVNKVINKVEGILLNHESSRKYGTIKNRKNITILDCNYLAKSIKLHIYFVEYTFSTDRSKLLY